ncbi:thioredoxin family protein [Salisediminibacterium halotolerans]|uniref:Small redox-active disulfide protein 2 n=1 Tax=Salisediminibacterium halotolerans TaxID=517425 RepID=A0A1H9V2B8_9BACI|nr:MULTISPECIES: thioredoxin family protein [Salisediminibacterium]RLJ71726.1 small redox-active disulfide protein 2 [Actinophytocola xinjiangensis]RPE86876.1 small redox-active disulfide protein 2 [Salisediminibacterium halotolerans]TWG32939.1 small redox-active disulfide protein 2 [Salisediminibacterium halotolerans]SES15514.1 small redox-active disulfide protein 2 [Salisediminibacterium haloalkalitolerans]GEL08205.1 redox-active disulfide protein 2 [Salisediminibacterium halotolerans]
MKIEILGTGCSKCKRLEERTNEAVTELGLEAEVVKVEELDQIMEYGVFKTPGLVVDGEVKESGKVPTVKAIKQLLS